MDTIYVGSEGVEGVVVNTIHVGSESEVWRV